MSNPFEKKNKLMISFLIICPGTYNPNISKVVPSNKYLKHKVLSINVGNILAIK